MDAKKIGWLVATAVAAIVGAIAAGAVLAAIRGDDRPTAAYPDEWVITVDEPSQLSVLLPERVEVQEETSEAANGQSLTIRTYVVDWGEGSVGFAVTEAPASAFDFQLGAEGAAAGADGTLESATPNQVAGYDGMLAEVTRDDLFLLFQIISLDEHIVQVTAVGPADERAEVEQDLGRLVDSVDFGET